MKSLRKILCWFMFLMVSLFFLSSKIEAKGKSLIVSQYHIDASVSANGDVLKKKLRFKRMVAIMVFSTTWIILEKKSQKMYLLPLKRVMEKLFH